MPSPIFPALSNLARQGAGYSEKFKVAGYAADSFEGEERGVPPAARLHGTAVPWSEARELLGDGNMTSWWKGVAVVAACLTLEGSAQAQLMPTQIGPARMPPEPAAMAPSQAPTPPLIAGPITPLDAPPGPPNSLSLPVNHSSAFQAENYTMDQGAFFHIGTQSLERQRMGFLPITFFGDTGGDTNPVFNPNLATQAGQRIGYNDPAPAFGVKATLGYLFNNHIVELTGYSITPLTRPVNADTQAALNLPFYNAPPGFGGNNGLFTDVDRVHVSLVTAIYNAELNYRYSDLAVTDCELILGLRYINQKDRISIYVGDDDLSTNGAFPNRQFEATYVSETRNHIIAPQIGFEYHRHCLWGVMSYGLAFKAAAGANLLEIDRELIRGDGRIGFKQTTNVALFSQVYDLNPFVELHLTHRAKARLGYTGMWLVDVGTAERQVNYDLGNRGRYPLDKHGSIFYHGASAELEFYF